MRHTFQANRVETKYHHREGVGGVGWGAREHDMTHISPPYTCALSWVPTSRREPTVYSLPERKLAGIISEASWTLPFTHSYIKSVTDPVSSAPEISPKPAPLDLHCLHGDPGHFSPGTPPVSDHQLPSVCPSSFTCQRNRTANQTIW